MPSRDPHTAFRAVTAGDPQPVAAMWTRAQRRFLCAVIALGLVLGWAGRHADLGLGGDEATYLTLSQSLERGRYNDEFLVGTPRHAQYPPATAAWILVVRRVAGPSLDAVRAANLLVLALAAILVADALRRLDMARLGIAAASLIAVNPTLHSLAGSVLSEALYIALTSISLWASIAVSRRTNRPRAALACIFAMLAFLTRSVGLAVLAAVVFSVARRMRRAAIIWVGAASLAVAGAWFGYTRSAGEDTIGHSYGVDIASAASGPVALAKAAANIAIEYVLRAPIFQFGFPNVPGTRLDTLIFASILLGLALAGFPMLVRRWSEAGVMLVLSGAILLVWPWADNRLLSPMLPWIIVSTLFGVLVVARRLGAATPERWALAVAGIIGAFGVITAGSNAAVWRSCRAEEPYADPRCYSSNHHSFALATNHVREELAPDAIIVTSEPSNMYALSGRQGRPHWEVQSDDGVTRFLHGDAGTHILLTRMVSDEETITAPVLLARCRELATVAVFPRGVLLAARDTTSATPDACPALTRYAAGTAADRN